VTMIGAAEGSFCWVCQQSCLSDKKQTSVFDFSRSGDDLPSCVKDEQLAVLVGICVCC
jgi:hypothetical protein